jgi:chromosome segregation ATPase
MANAKVKVGSPEADGDRQSIEQLTERYKKLDREKTVAETNLKNAQDHLSKLKKEAREQHGTDDIDALKKKLKQLQDDNEQKRGAYQKKLDEIETALADVKSRYGDVEAPGNDEA